MQDPVMKYANKDKNIIQEKMTKMRVGPNLVVKGRVNMDDIDILVKLDEAIQQANELEQMIDVKKARD